MVTSWPNTFTVHLRLYGFKASVLETKAPRLCSFTLYLQITHSHPPGQAAGAPALAVSDSVNWG